MKVNTSEINISKQLLVNFDLKISRYELSISIVDECHSSTHSLLAIHYFRTIIESFPAQVDGVAAVHWVAAPWSVRPPVLSGRSSGHLGHPTEDAPTTPSPAGRHRRPDAGRICE